MDSTLFSKIRKILRKNSKLLKHSERTLYWIKKLNPNPSEALQIAALAHDIERIFYGDWVKKRTSKKIIKKHQKLSGRVIEKILEKEKADPKLIREVVYLVSNHETGGTKESGILKDADSVSYLEVNASRHIKNYKDIGKNKMKKKLESMFKRIGNKKAKNIAKPVYEKRLKELEMMK